VWSERIRAWRASGVSASQFAQDQGLAVSTLRYWASRLSEAPKPQFLRLVPKSPAVAPPSSSELVVEVGAARIRVTAGFDAALLSGVVQALNGVAR
jgi:transcriptional regulator with XRE-family HTH domain